MKEIPESAEAIAVHHRTSETSFTSYRIHHVALSLARGSKNSRETSTRRGLRRHLNVDGFAAAPPPAQRVEADGRGGDELRS